MTWTIIYRIKVSVLMRLTCSIVNGVFVSLVVKWFESLLTVLIYFLPFRLKPTHINMLNMLNVRSILSNPQCLSGKADVKNHLTTTYIRDLFMNIRLLKNGPSFRNEIRFITSECIFCVVTVCSCRIVVHFIILFFF